LLPTKTKHTDMLEEKVCNVAASWSSGAFALLPIGVFVIFRRTPRTFSLEYLELVVWTCCAAALLHWHLLSKEERPGSESKQTKKQLRHRRARVQYPSSHVKQIEKQYEEILSNQIAELCTPLQASDQIVEQITIFVEKVLKARFPELEVAGDACFYLHKEPKSSFTSSLQVSINVSTQLDSVLKDEILDQCKVNNAKDIQCTTISVLTNLLVAPEVGFRLGRKLFRKTVPSALLIAPQSFQESESPGPGISIQLFVNCTCRLHSLHLINECTKIEPRAKEFILLVQRWSKERGVCSSGKGDLTPFAWTLLAVYFLQMGIPGGSLLPPLQGFKSTNGSIKFSISGDATEWTAPAEGPATALSLGRLFKDFFEFYASRINRCNDVISIRSGVRSAPICDTTRHVSINAVDNSVGGLCIEDPFDPAQILLTGMTSTKASRLQRELQRSVHLLQDGGSLLELLASDSSV